MPLPNSRRPSYIGITITSGVEEIPLPNSRRPSHGGITITSGVEEIPLPNSRRPRRAGVTITSGVEEMPLPNSRRPSYIGITITSGVEEIPLPNSRRPSHGGIITTAGVEEIQQCRIVKLQSSSSSSMLWPRALTVYTEGKSSRGGACVKCVRVAWTFFRQNKTFRTAEVKSPLVGINYLCLSGVSAFQYCPLIHASVSQMVSPFRLAVQFCTNFSYAHACYMC
jgi:hypothetical protein